MNPVFPAQKRAEEFSSMVEDSSTSELRDTGRYAELVPLVGLVTSLRSTPAPEARPEFVASLRERLMLAAETALVPDTAAQVEARQPAARRTSRERRLAVAIGGFALVSASASMSVAAQTALPGDTLYPLKRALENVHENVLRDADDKGSTMLDNASSRLDEVDELSRTGGQDPKVIAQTLQDFSDQAVEASGVLIKDYEKTGRLSSIAELRSFTATSLEALERLKSLVPVEVRAVLINAAQVLDEIDRQARTLCPTCSDLPVVGSGGVDNAASIGDLYEDLLDRVVTPPSAEGKGKGTPKDTKAPVSGADPAPQATETPEPPTEPKGPPSLTPDPDDDTPGTNPGGGLDTVVKGLGTLDLEGILTGVTETLDDVLGGGKTDK